MQHYQTIQGVEVPALGFGTWPMKGQACREAVADALAIGYRHIDTARMYGNEAAVGQGIKDSGVAREEIFLTTKLWYTELTRSKVREAVQDSLRNLQTDYVDLLLIHWPSSSVPVGETLAAMSQAQQEGKARHIGVSNFPPNLLQEALRHARIFCDQVEYHPFLSQQGVLKICQENGVLVTAYAPIAHGAVMQNRQIEEIGRQHSKSAAQVTLRWLIQQKNVAAIPKAASAERRRQNFDIFDFQLTNEEMEQLYGLAQGKRLIDPAWAPAW